MAEHADHTPVSDSTSAITFVTTDNKQSTMPAKTHNQTLRDLNGTWNLSKPLSTGVPLALEIQGFNSPIRKAIISSPIKIAIMQSHYPSQIFIKQQPATSSSNTLGANIPFITERWYPPQKTSTWSDWVSDYSVSCGDTKSRSRWVRGTDFEHKDGIGYLTEGLGRLTEYFEAEVECPRAGWKRAEVWFVEMGRLIRRVVTFGKEGRRAETKYVYEFETR